MDAITTEPAHRFYKYWRTVGTAFSFITFGLGASALALVLLVLVFPLPVRSSVKQRWTRRSICASCWVYIRMAHYLGLMSFRFHDTHHLTNSGQLIIANHPTLIDVIFLLSIMPNTNCIVKSALWKNPFTWGLVSLAGYIRNDGEHLIDRAAAFILQGQSLIVFPEGTRSSIGQTLRFKRGAANIALAAGCGITPVVIDCQPTTLQKNDRWYQVPDTPPIFQLQALPAIDYNTVIDHSRPKSIQVRHLTRYLEQIYRRHLGSFG